jgi:hypothetical protein
MGNDSPNNDHGATGSSTRQEQKTVPVYRKPVLRKYDQIGQVKPYGPSELEAG